ncbi:MAG: GDP-mannose-dependent alpha-(1-6)-phosphatidylinositol monomannoside mannosyltransferase [Chloroflexi bacterium ADurb.Bin325]|nr:MAG: GDP-mannose-dependent alpha-(1-6)-phosphatidylinositol monomannoside mannosyltransferase [Chloroflexi bacterium ADurb.Bin325]
MKIGVLTHNYPRFPGDFSGRFVEALSEELARQRHAVTVIAPWDAAFVPRPAGSPVTLRLYRYAPRAGWHRLGYMRTMQADVRMRGLTYLLAPGMFAAGARAVMGWAAAARPDVLHAHWALPNGFLAALAARRYRIPLVVSIPGSDATVAAQNPLFGRMARFAFDAAGLITSNASELRDAAVHDLGADPRKFDLIAYGVDPDALRPDTTGVAGLRAQLGIPDDAVVLLAVGRMVYKKGFDYLLRAAALLKESAPDLFARLRLVMVGEGDLWAEWQALGRELGLTGAVHWVGNAPTEAMGVFNNLADIAVMPAVSKPATGLAVSVLDAMSCGKPIVASRAAGNDLAVRDGVNGLLVPEQDAPALADALARLAADPALRAEMGAASRCLIETELGWPQLAARYVAHFERLRAGLRR